MGAIMERTVDLRILRGTLHDLADIVTDARCAYRDALADPSRADHAELLAYGKARIEQAEDKIRAMLERYV